MTQRGGRQDRARQAGRADQRTDQTTAETPLLTGVLQLHPSGRGFVDIGAAYDDLLVSRGAIGPAIDGDTVEVEAWEGRSRREARVVRVLTRGRTRLTGIFEVGRAGEQPRLRPDDPRILSPVTVTVIEPGAAGAAPSGRRDRSAAGQAVLARITGYPEAEGGPLEVEIERVLGEPGLLLTEVDKCLAGRGVEPDFAPEVQAAAEGVPGWVNAADKAERLDLRDRHFVTIDPLNARDFDDAVAIEQGPGDTTRVWVAVADVSHYVAEGSTLDEEARRRGCSIYLPDRAIPMLPPALSSGICSLVPRRDRLAMVVRLDVSPRGQIKDHGCVAAVIHSRGRLDYRGVAAALGGDFEGKRAAYREHSDLLAALSSVTSALRRRRVRRGCLDLDLPEAQIVLDQDDPSRVRQIVQSRPDTPVKRAYSLVEELMIAANEAVAQQFVKADAPAIWRIHPAPRPEALVKLAAWMNSYGVQTRPEDLAREHGMGALVEQLRTHRAARPLSYLVLRTLKQATYAISNVGHFGLASRAYLHFTSPIRRYPDLYVHRLLKDLLRRQGAPAGAAATRRGEVDREQLREVARAASAAERLAIEVEREVHRVYASSLMRDRIGELLGGQISGISTFGFFVSLDEPFVEGLVKAETLEHSVHFDPEQLRLYGRGRQSRIFSLGDRVLVRVTDTSVLRRQVDLTLAVDDAERGDQAHEPDPAALRAREDGGGADGARGARGDRQRYQRDGGGRGARSRSRKTTRRTKTRR